MKKSQEKIKPTPKIWKAADNMEIQALTRDYRLQQWASIITRRNGSGMTVRAWCDEQGINQKSFYYWQRKLREAAGAQATGLSTVSSPVPTGWASLGVQAEPSGGQGLIVEVGGCRVHVQAQTDTPLLVRVCQALKTL
ncbi:MAG: IS66 family insertion sequence element accessory protein TnpB [Christensenellales bacterium]